MALRLSEGLGVNASLCARKSMTCSLPTSYPVLHMIALPLAKRGSGCPEALLGRRQSLEVKPYRSCQVAALGFSCRALDESACHPIDSEARLKPHHRQEKRQAKRLDVLPCVQQELKTKPNSLLRSHPQSATRCGIGLRLLLRSASVLRLRKQAANPDCQGKHAKRDLGHLLQLSIRVRHRTACFLR